ncbi:nitrous oxide reductase family maturation protein NosD [Streptomyces sp. NPDC057638]|uniref:right-handed parallel beta-helix repeat-containing protein n=1 Tax=Streptomyces sp. NPDC057638 TaxID=3346190 RepID=UPI003674BE5D
MISLTGMPSSTWFAAVGATALFSLSVTAPIAHAAPLACGQTITTSVVLAADLLNCPGDGLVVGRRGITIDLNGHTVDGVGLGTGIRTNGFDNTTITNGGGGRAVIQEFDYGVQLTPGTSGTLVKLLTIQNNELSGVELDNADNSNHVVDNVIQRQSQRGITVIGGSSGNVISTNTITANQSEGVYVQNSTANRLEDNQITDSGDGGLLLEGADGNTLLGNTVARSSDSAVVLQAGSDNNLVQGNTVSEGNDAAVKVSHSTGNRLLSNHLQGSGDSGIFLQFSHGSTITGNDVSANTSGIELNHSDDNLIRSNLANNTTGDGIVLEDSIDNDLELNRTNGNSARGISVSGDAPAGQGNRLLRNTADANLGDGIYVSKTVHTLQGNTTRDNDGWGILVDQGNTDGGANRASGNSEAAQCMGVVCTP